MTDDADRGLAQGRVERAKGLLQELRGLSGETATEHLAFYLGRMTFVTEELLAAVDKETDHW